jgi:hypothetical protein
MTKPSGSHPQFRAVRSEPALTGSLEPLWLAIARTIRWAAPRTNIRDPQRCLRSELARPRTLEKDYFAAVAMACLPRRVDVVTPAARDLAGGRLLIYFPDLDLCCGAAEAESQGFFDVWNCPPRDTWVACIQETSGPDPYLLAWVPPALIPLADRGIQVNPEQCILWLDDSDVELRAAMRT